MVDWLRRLFSSSSARRLQPAAPNAGVAARDDAPAADALGVFWVARNDVSADFTHWLFDARDDADIFVTPLERQVLAALEKIVKAPKAGANLVRRMPGVIPELLQSLRSENFSGAELARKLSNDVVLVAEVVRLANCGMSIPGQSITSVEHAVLVLGQDNLRQLISSVAFRPIIDLKTGYFTRLIAPRLWLQSERCAMANRLLAADERVNPFEAFLAGLIQQVGLIVSLRVMEQIAGSDTTLGSASFCNLLLEQSRALSCSVAREWQFPAAIVAAIEEQGSKYNLAGMSPMGRVLSSGDYLSKVVLLLEAGHLSPGGTKGLSRQALVTLDMLRTPVPAVVDQ
ncbi:HD-like signal output (HDOD) protein [Actimicrobium sp. GrIS 1.19]|uniref:HDOD domain-containing protein n=1 Tax=Actimicrobium sp. GrIS 1.19 TaxID=3071708 RepID=UPI002E08BFBF|nr:HD-like signal output (HDOD) protein [Actimicrobium sp. GrIS 1.19]